MKTKALAHNSVLNLSPGERSIGRLLDLDLPQPTYDQGEIDLAADLMFGLYSNPKFKSEIPPERKLNHKLLEWSQKFGGWEQNRSYTEANLCASMAAGSLLWNLLVSNEQIKKAIELQEQLDQAKQEARSQQTIAELLVLQSKAKPQDDSDEEDLADEDAADDESDEANETDDDIADSPTGEPQDETDEDSDDADAENTSEDESANDSDSELDPMVADAQAKADQAAQDAKALESQLDNALESLGKSDFAQAQVSSAVKDAAQEAKDTADQMSGWGMGPGADARVDPKAAMDFSKKHDEKLKLIAKLAGRLRGIAMHARRERVTYGVTPVDARMTKDLTSLFPTELALLRKDAPPAIRAQKVAQWADSGLLGWHKANDAKEQGPFVAATDTSGSMYGERDTVAKAVALAIAQTAKAENRAYQLFTFSTSVGPFVDSTQGLSDLMDWASRFTGGGTSFDVALTELMKRLDSMAQRARGTDAVFISDGESLVSKAVADEWKKRKEKLGFRLLYTEIGRYGYHEAYEGTVCMKDLADLFIPLDELTSDQGDALAAQLAKWMR